MTTRRPGRWAAAVVVLAASCAAGPAAAAPTPDLALTGYVESGDGARPVDRNAAALTTVGVDGVNLTPDGGSVAPPDAADTKLLARAHAAGLRAELLVGNFSGRLGDFDETAAHRMLTVPAHRAAVVQRLTAFVAAGWDGIHLDLESLNGTDRAGLTAFTRELRQALPAGKTVAMAVMAARSTSGYRTLGYDLPALAPVLDRVVLMAYDQHGPGWSSAGAVGGLPWVRAVLAALMAQVPAAQVDLGVAGYGYGWPDSGGGRQYSDAAARAAAVDPAWDGQQAEWHGALAGGGELWWSDHRSLQVREQLAQHLHLHGVAVWSLGLSDRLQ